jgi:hypothetical protein
MLIIGTHFFTWGSDMTAVPFQCGRCGHVGPFIAKKGMRFLTLFFVIPVCPLSGVSHMVECARCGTRYAVEPGAVALAAR